MTSPADSDIGALIAALHPHIFQYLFNDPLHTDNSVEPRQSRKLSLALLDTFAVLLAYHPECESVAITAQTHRPGHASLYICPSPRIPHEFHDNVRRWLDLFSELRKERKRDGGVPHDGLVSESEKRFMLYTHHLCYPAMRQRAISKNLYEWDAFIELTVPGPDTEAMEPIDEEEERLREELKDELRHLSELAQAFVESISRVDLGEDEDVLQFHALCLAIRDPMKGAAPERFLNICFEGVNKTLKYLRLPIAVSTLLALSRNPKLYIENHCSVIVLDPSLGSRPFNALMTETDFSERFGDEPCIYLERVVRTFHQSAEGAGAYCEGLHWDAQERVLSSSGSVIVYPEVTLIQYLLENGERETKAYIVCSEVPCYASVLYAGVVNKALEARFTIRTDHPDWCRLYSAAPWVLPEATRQEVVDALREKLLRDLGWVTAQWWRL